MANTVVINTDQSLVKRSTLKRGDVFRYPKIEDSTYMVIAQNDEDYPDLYLEHGELEAAMLDYDVEVLESVTITREE